MPTFPPKPSGPDGPVNVWDCTATAIPVTYAIYPKEGRNSSMVAEVEAALTELVEEPTDLYASTTNSLGLNFWTLPLTPDQADKLRKHPGFDHWSLDRIDWVVKVADFDGVRRQDDSQTDLNHSHEGKAHGTSMLALVAGKTLGVAKSIKPHLARLPRGYPFGGGFSTEDYIETIGEIDNRITADPGGKFTAVLLLAHSYHREVFNRKKPNGEVEKLNVRTSGPKNDDNYGHGSDLEKGLPHVYAPGFDLMTANGNTFQWETEGYLKSTSGTSDAQLGELKNDDGTPVPDTVAGIRGYIMDKSWSRGQEKFFDGLHDRNGIWNGFDLNQRACKWNPNNPLQQRRQEGAVCEIPLPSTTSSSEASSTTKAQPTRTKTPETPLVLKDVVCEDENDFLGHGDVSPQSQAGFAETFCGGDLAEERSKTLGPDDDAMEELKRDGGGISYNYSISWIKGCKIEVDTQYVQWPIGDEDRFSSCSQIFQKAYDDCINGGVGGCIDAGCLRYRFIGAK
ncbi:hypothetical protein G7Z17_g8691 [Cylindrodendrum hubeiense]|uniref:Uncharacterized protein n=1 Tax=Cylindrodendrum hubeiense TaxID=595255 RepID=A0A9P5L8S9_9HYPO|nr:hypothetical protein G7Z17_g8691 [Cylindrodendrum hubeiense]